MLGNPRVGEIVGDAVAVHVAEEQLLVIRQRDRGEPAAGFPEELAPRAAAKLPRSLIVVHFFIQSR